MTFTHTDIHERLIDFLYGELDAEARAAFDAHVATCDACRSEVRAFEQTRAAARAVVRAPLEEPVPSAVRARVMDAAARATTARGAAAGHAAAPIAAGPPARRSSRWLAWLRARWAVPMFVTVAAMGALLLVRETIFREARRPLGENPPADLAPKGAAPPSEVAPRAGHERDKAVALPPSAKPSASPVVSGYAAPDADRHAAKETASARGDENLRAGGGKHRRGSPVQAPKKAAVADPKAIRKRESLDLGQARPVDDFEADLSSNGYSDSPAPTMRRAPSVPAAESPAQPRATARGSLEGLSSSSPPTAFAGGPPATDRAEARPATREDEQKSAPKPAKRSVSDALEEPSAAGAPAPAPAAASASAPAPDPAAAQVDRAEKLMAAQRWNDAAIAYRALIQRFPRHASVPMWRRRLAAAEAAAARDDQPFATPPPPR